MQIYLECCTRWIYILIYCMYGDFTKICHQWPPSMLHGSKWDYSAKTRSGYRILSTSSSSIALSPTSQEKGNIHYPLELPYIGHNNTHKKLCPDVCDSSSLLLSWGILTRHCAFPLLSTYPELHSTSSPSLILVDLITVREGESLETPITCFLWFL